MTSNAGAREIGRQRSASRASRSPEAVFKAVEKIFSPEFRNRLDGVVNFHNLDEAVVARIVRKMILEFTLQLREKKVGLSVSPAAVAWVAKRGFSRIFGAREVARLVQEKIKNPFVDEVLFGRLKEGGSARIDAVKNDLVITVGADKKGKSKKAKGKSEK